MHGLQTDKGLTCRGSVTSAWFAWLSLGFARRASRHLVHGLHVPQKKLACRETALIGNFGSCSHSGSRFIKKNKQLAVSSVFSDVFPHTPVTRICKVALAPEDREHVRRASQRRCSASTLSVGSISLRVDKNAGLRKLGKSAE